MAMRKKTAKKTAAPKKASKKAATTTTTAKPQPKPQPAKDAATPPAKNDAARKDTARDPRIPASGTVLERKFKDKVYEVKVHDSDFEFRGRRYRSLSGIAKEITGAQTNGFLSFGLIPREGTKKGS